MEYRKLGESELELPSVVLGAWAIGGWYWGGTDDRKAVQAIQTALGLGMTAIDTAPVYGFGHSERIIGQAIAGRRAQVVLASKCGLRWDIDEGEPLLTAEDSEGHELTVRRCLRRDSIIWECEQSLRRLGVDTIDLYQCHWPDPSTPLEETMEAMVRLLEAGKIRAIGLSNYSAEQIARCRELAPIASDQPRYSLLDREIEQDVLPYCREHGVGVLAYGPLHQGLLTGKVGPERQFPPGDWRGRLPSFTIENRRRVLAALEEVRPIAEKHRATFAQLAIAWVIGRPGVTAALVGARSPEQVEENARAGEIYLTPVEQEQLAQAFAGLGVRRSGG